MLTKMVEYKLKGKITDEKLMEDDYYSFKF